MLKSILISIHLIKVGRDTLTSTVIVFYFFLYYVKFLVLIG